MIVNNFSHILNILQSHQSINLRDITAAHSLVIVIRYTPTPLYLHIKTLQYYRLGNSHGTKLILTKRPISETLLRTLKTNQMHLFLRLYSTLYLSYLTILMKFSKIKYLENRPRYCWKSFSFIIIIKLSGFLSCILCTVTLWIQFSYFSINV